MLVLTNMIFLLSPDRVSSWSQVSRSQDCRLPRGETTTALYKPQKNHDLQLKSQYGAMVYCTCSTNNSKVGVVVNLPDPQCGNPSVGPSGDTGAHPVPCIHFVLLFTSFYFISTPSAQRIRCRQNVKAAVLCLVLNVEAGELVWQGEIPTPPHNICGAWNQATKNAEPYFHSTHRSRGGWVGAES